MQWNAWGDAAAAKPLSPGIRALLKQALGIEAHDLDEPSADEVRLRPSALSQSDRNGLSAIVGAANVTVDDRARLLRAGGKSTMDLLRRRDFGVQDAPDAVLLPGGEDEVAQILTFCADRSIAVVPFGGGTSVVGGLDPLRGDFKAVVSLDLHRLDELHALDEVSWEAELGAGLSGPEAERLLGEHGFALGHYPQSFLFATIGGFAATRSSGQDSAGYGRFDDMVRGLRAVTPAGILDLGRAPESAAGPDLRQLLIGSEGTLGIITRVRVRIHPIPEATRYEAWSFPDFATGADALRAVVQTGTGPTVIRLSDEAETGVNLATTENIGETQVTDERLREEKTSTDERLREEKTSTGERLREEKTSTGERLREEKTSTGGCLAITAFEGTEAHVASRHAETRALLEAGGGTSLGEEPARAWEHGRFSAPYLRDALLSAGALG